MGGDTSDDRTKKAEGPGYILVTPYGGDDEIRGLTRSMGWAEVEAFLQRKRPNPRTYVGPGRVERIGKMMDYWDEVNPGHPIFLVVDDSIHPRMKLALEQYLDREVLDRVDVILRIFDGNARSREAALQVELARLKYSIPVLREGIHMAKIGDRAGYGAGGEMAFTVRYRDVSARIQRIRKEIASISRRWGMYRDRRRQEGFTLCSLTGYTNVGKSSLLKAITGKEVEVNDALFTTLEIRTGRPPENPDSYTGSNGNDVGRQQDGSPSFLLTDTVGLISGFPLELVESFRPTLDEVRESDVVLFVVDGSRGPDELHLQVASCWTPLLSRLDLGKVIPVINKMDAVPEEDSRKGLLEVLGDWDFVNPPIFTSAHSREGLEKLLQVMEEVVTRPSRPDEVEAFDEEDVLGEEGMSEDEMKSLDEGTGTIRNHIRLDQKE